MEKEEKDVLETTAQDVKEALEIVEVVEDTIEDSVDKGDTPVNPTVKTFNVESLKDMIDNQEEIYSFLRYIKKVLRNPIQNFPKSCNKYAMGILGVGALFVSIGMFVFMDLVANQMYRQFRGRYRLSMIKAELSSAFLAYILLFICGFLLAVLLDKLFTKWLLRERIDYVDLLAKYGQILLLPMMLSVLVLLLVSINVPQWMSILVAAIALSTWSIGQMAQMFMRAKEAKAPKIAPFYYVLTLQAVATLVVVLLVNVR